MSIYRFAYKHNAGPEDGTSDDVTVVVEYNDHNEGNIDNVVNAFLQFLEGVGFTHDTVAKYLNSSLTK